MQLVKLHICKMFPLQLVLFLPLISASERFIGNLAKQCEFPFIASIRNSENNHICAGSLVHFRWVLTAAYCTTSQENLSVVLGINNLDDEGTVVPVDSVYSHNKFDGINFNLAMLKLKYPVTRETCINVLHLKYLSIPLIRNDVEFISWPGKNDSSVSNELTKITVTMVEKNKCQSRYGNLPDGQMCIQSNYLNRALCNGENGSPLIYVNTLTIPKLIGIASYGTGLCQTQSPDVFEFIPHHYNWIKSIIAEK